MFFMWFYFTSVFSKSFGTCWPSSALFDRNKPQIPVTDLIIRRYIKERDPRSVGNEGGLGTAWTVCIPGEMAFSSPRVPACTLLWTSCSTCCPLPGQLERWECRSWEYSAGLSWAQKAESSDGWAWNEESWGQLRVCWTVIRFFAWAWREKQTC